MAFRPRILLVGDEISLLQTRGTMLRTRFEVNISPRLSEAFGLVLNQRFDIILVFPEAQNWEDFAEYIARRNLSPQIIAVLPNDHCPSWADEIVPIKLSSFDLLRVCARRLGFSMTTKSHGYSNRSFKKVVSISSGHNR